MSLGAVGELHQDVHVVGDGHRLEIAVVIHSAGHGDLGHCHYLGRRAGPANHAFVPNTHIEDIVAAESAVLPPVQRGAGIHETGGQHLSFHRQQVAQIAVGHQLLYQIIHPKGGRPRHNLGHQVGPVQRGVEHRFGFIGIRGHPGLAKDVFALFQSGHGEVGMHIGPGADADGVDGWVVQQIPPVIVNGGDVERIGYPLA